MDWNFDEIGVKLNKIAEGMPTIFADMKVIIANDVKAKHRQRLDAGQPRKQYKSEAYKKVRAAQGRQTSYIDMQLSGELVRSMTIGKDGNDVVYGVMDRRDGKTTTSTIYRGQIERNNHGDLVQINKDDTTRGIEAANRYFTDKIRELFDQV